MKQDTCPKRAGRFINPHTQEDKRTLLDVVRWKSGRYGSRKPEMPVPEGFSFPLPELNFEHSKPSAVWINHSTYLIKIGGLHILTDPIWSTRCSPVNFAGPKRQHPPGLKLEELPKIDFVLISHDHYDHLDKKTVHALIKRFPDIKWLVPTGVKRWFERQKVTAVEECGWWDEAELSFPQMKLKITAVPAQHFSGRTGRDRNHTLWTGWVVEFHPEGTSAKTLYFVGDTGYNAQDFKAIGKRWAKIDLSLIPIGSYLPYRFMAPVHVDPQDSVRIHKEVNSVLSLGMHWKTFPSLSDEPAAQPPYDLWRALNTQNVDPSTFLAIEPGYEINW